MKRIEFTRKPHDFFLSEDEQKEIQGLLIQIPEGAVDWKISGTNYICFKEWQNRVNHKADIASFLVDDYDGEPATIPVLEWQAYPERLLDFYEIKGKTTAGSKTFFPELESETDEFLILVKKQ